MRHETPATLRIQKARTTLLLDHPFFGSLLFRLKGRENHRLVAFENDRVSFRWRDYAHGDKKKVMTISADEFLHRFLLHVLPKGLVRIRHFGLFANRRRQTALARCRELLGAATSAERSETTNLPRCPVCSATMRVTASAANACGSVQTTLSKLPRIK